MYVYIYIYTYSYICIYGIICITPKKEIYQIAPVIAPSVRHVDRETFTSVVPNPGDDRRTHGTARHPDEGV